MQLIIYIFNVIAQCNIILESQRYINLNIIHTSVIKAQQSFQQLMQCVIEVSEKNADEENLDEENADEENLSEENINRDEDFINTDMRLKD